MKLTPVVLFFTAALLSADPFWLRNTDTGARFSYWIIGPQKSPDRELAGLPLAAGGRHDVAPGEKVLVNAGVRSVVGVFVPLSPEPTFLTPLSGGYILNAEFPTRGTVLIDRASFAAANRGRVLQAPLQAWGLDLPRLVLDGITRDWNGVSILLEWGPGFQPGLRPWPPGWPRLKTLQATDREGALWLRMVSEPGSFPQGTSVSLILRRPGAFLEWPLTGAGTVWSWVEGADPIPVGTRTGGAGDWEAWVPWDRLSQAEHGVWTAAAAGWSLVVTAGGLTQTLALTSTSLKEWP